VKFPAHHFSGEKFMKFLAFLTLALLVPSLANAITVADRYALNNQMGGVAHQRQLGNLVNQNVHTIHLTWDPSGKSAHRSGTAVAFDTFQETIPINALVIRVLGVVETAVTSTSNNGTIAVNCLSAGDLLVAVDPDPAWYAGDLVGGALTGTITAGSTFAGLRVAAGCSPTFTVATNNFLTGKVHLFVEYVVAD
jgi:uncharacterized protein (DUF697 family)